MSCQLRTVGLKSSETINCDDKIKKKNNTDII